MSSIDIFPTLLGIVNRLPQGRFLDQVSGNNVLDDRFLKKPIFGQNTGRKLNDQTFPVYVLTTEKWKYVHLVGGNDQLFNLESDPFELNNVFLKQPEISAELKSQLFEELTKQSQKGAQYQHDRFQETQKMSPELLQQLKSLGYVDN